MLKYLRGEEVITNDKYKKYVKILLMSRGGDLGMMIMMLCGFAAYMTHIGANDMVVKLASKPLQYINSPYLLMIAEACCCVIPENSDVAVLVAKLENDFLVVCAVVCVKNSKF